MFEDYTYENLLEEVLADAPDNVDTRQGSIFYDAVSGILVKVAKLYTDLELIFTLSQINTATGEYLDVKASEYGITRQAATAAEYYFVYEGTTPDVGERFFTDGLYFVLAEDDEGLYLIAEEAGSGGNGVYEGTAAIPVNNISGLTSASFGEIKTYGADEEEDDVLRNRVCEKISGPAENGNKQHYKTWCEEIEGVGAARITPLWNGPNTVKGVVISTAGHACSSSVVAEVQDYIDPATKGYTATVDGKTYTVGDGLGEGVANLGAHFTATTATETEIDISLDAELQEEIDEDTAKEDISTAIEAYLKNLVLTADDAEEATVRYTAIGAIISGTEDVVDYYNLTLNGSTENITVDDDGIPVLGEVTLNVV